MFRFWRRPRKLRRASACAFAHLLSVSGPVADSLKDKAQEMNVPLLQDLRRGLQSIRHLIEYSEFKNRSRSKDLAPERKKHPAARQGNAQRQEKF